MNRLRIAVGGIRHETNTFSSVLTAYDDFTLSRGQASLDSLLADFGRQEALDLSPTFIASARPSGLVRREAYQRLKDDLLRELAATLPVDGLLLDLHGAMEVETIGDAESDLVQAVRQLVGADVLISVSLDLHGNISPALVNEANILTAFRTAPHRDYPETRLRALQLLVQALRQGLRPISVLTRLPILLSGEEAVTDREPARSLYHQLSLIDQIPGIMNASLLIGCAWTDSPYTSLSIIVVAERDQSLAQGQATRFARQIWAKRGDFNLGVEAASIDETIRRAIGAPERPVFISDSGDNVTAGGAGDIPLFVERLLALGAQDALVAGLCDPEAVQACAAAGEGATVTLSIGGKLDQTHNEPLPITAHVKKLTTHPTDQPTPPTLALVQVAGLHIILATDRRAFTTRAAIAAAGIDPMQQKLVIVKQGYLFPDLADHVPHTLMALSPGATNLQLSNLPYRHLTRPIFPLDDTVSF